jgi:hypothetical protein
MINPNSKKMLKSNKNVYYYQFFKFFSIILVILLLDVLFHQIIRLIYPDPNFTAESIQKKLPYIILIMTGFFSSIGLGFLVIKNYIPRTPLERGMLYGILNSTIYFIAFLEMPILFNDDIFVIILNALADIIPLFILGIILGLIFSKNDITKETIFINKTSVIILIIFSLMFLLGRYFTYLIGDIINTRAFIGAYYTKPLESILWSAVFGLSVGFLYVFIQPVIKKNSWTLHKTILIFVTIIFGIQWILYTLFYPIIIDESILISEALIRGVCDCLYFSAAIILIQILADKM